MPNFGARPGLLFVVATLLPLASFLLIFLASGAWCLARRYRDKIGDGAYNLFGGDKPGKLPAFVALGAIVLAFCCCITGFVLYYADHHHHLASVEDIEHEIETLEREQKIATDKAAKEKLHEQ